jgi:UDP-hydrolysing UDP-N-acetyl-D-glucosamine 2-epimerase
MSAGPPRHVGVVTGSRAEYGLLRGLLRELASDPAFRLSLIVTGSHLSAQHGSTRAEILADGLEIAATVDMQLGDDSRPGVLRSMGRALAGFAEALPAIGPDILVILGDRYEALCAAIGAMVVGIPIAHVHGGERTLGAIDDAIRHSISKMAHVHFVAAPEYGRRLQQLGEDPSRIFFVGAPALDSIEAARPFSSRIALEQELAISFGVRNFLVTYHPVTLESGGQAQAVRALLGALDTMPDAHVFFTGANADAEGSVVDRMVTEFVAVRPGQAWRFASLGQKRYFSMASHVDAVLGNSSSGVIEIPLLGVPSVNIGPRQAGRIMPESVVSCNAETSSILAAVARATSLEFRALAGQARSPYGTPGASRRMKTVLADVDLGTLLMKDFRDIAVRDESR